MNNEHIYSRFSRNVWKKRKHQNGMPLMRVAKILLHLFIFFFCFLNNIFCWIFAGRFFSVPPNSFMPKWEKQMSVSETAEFPMWKSSLCKHYLRNIESLRLIPTIWTVNLFKKSPFRKDTRNYSKVTLFTFSWLFWRKLSLKT